MIDDNRIPATSYGGLGWQAKAGLAYRLSPNWDVVAEGTYSGVHSYTDQGTYICHYNDYGAKVGIRYRFRRPAPVVVLPAAAVVTPPVVAPEVKSPGIPALW